MGTSTKATKARRAILAMAQQWKDVFDELPFLEEAGDLNERIVLSQDTLKSLAGQEADARAKLDIAQHDMADAEKDAAILRKNLKDAQGTLATAQKAAQEVSAQAQAVAKVAADKVLKDTSAEAAKMLAVANDEIKKARADGIADVNKYRTNLKKEIDGYERRLSDLQDKIAETEKVHATAMDSLVSIRKLVGMEKL